MADVLRLIGVLMVFGFAAGLFIVAIILPVVLLVWLLS